MFKDTTLQPGYPHDLVTLGSGVPPHGIDSAIWWEDVGKTYFFKGDRSVRCVGGSHRVRGGDSDHVGTVTACVVGTVTAWGQCVREVTVLVPRGHSLSKESCASTPELLESKIFLNIF